MHIRIDFDLLTRAGINQTRFVNEAADLVLRYGGPFPANTATAGHAANCFRKCTART